ncbi:MAG: PIN domain-containing protein [Nitrospira sp. CR2.1]|nr:PIN domain-containing protein [Nitrospira sp. CR2.1]
MSKKLVLDSFALVSLFHKKPGWEKVRAAEALHLLEHLPIELVEVDLPLVREAAEIKSEHAVSYADAFCIATARRLSATVLTSDPEFHAVEHLIAVRWLTD